MKRGRKVLSEHGGRLEKSPRWPPVNGNCHWTTAMILPSWRTPDVLLLILCFLVFSIHWNSRFVSFIATIVGIWRSFAFKYQFCSSRLKILLRPPEKIIFFILLKGNTIQFINRKNNKTLKDNIIYIFFLRL